MLEKPTGSSAPGCLLRTPKVHKGNTTGLVLFGAGLEARSPLWKVRSGTGIIPPGWCPPWSRSKGTVVSLKTLTYHRYTLRCRSPFHTTGLVSALLGPGVEGTVATLKFTTGIHENRVSPSFLIPTHIFEDFTITPFRLRIDWIIHGPPNFVTLTENTLSKHLQVYLVLSRKSIALLLRRESEWVKSVWK